MISMFDRAARWSLPTAVRRVCFDGHRSDRDDGRREYP
jgi:hypothetical protein